MIVKFLTTNDTYHSNHMTFVYSRRPFGRIYYKLYPCIRLNEYMKKVR